MDEQQPSAAGPDPADEPVGTLMTDAQRQVQQNWIDRNPLRRWRHAHSPKVAMHDAARMLGVGISMVQNYERGVHYPGRSKNRQLTEMLGPDWADRWDRWLAVRPGPRRRSPKPGKTKR